MMMRRMNLICYPADAWERNQMQQCGLLPMRCCIWPLVVPTAHVHGSVYVAYRLHSCTSYPPEENPRLTKLSLTMYDEPYVPHVPVGLPHCRVVTRPRGNKRKYTLLYMQLLCKRAQCTQCRGSDEPWVVL